MKYTITGLLLGLLLGLVWVWTSREPLTRLEFPK